jgi:sugar/nucleoside kinase (ribokinase family)
VGVGGVGRGTVYALDGTHDLGRNESRPARLLDVRDYCKLHIIAHYPSLLLGAPAQFQVVPIAKVGHDEAGRGLAEEMRQAGMDCRFVETVAGLPTLQSVCFQYPDGSGGNLTASNSAAAALRESDVERAADLIDRRTIALAAPEVPLPVRGRLLRLATERGAFRVASFTSVEVVAARSSGLLQRCDLLALNEDEASALTGLRFDAREPAPMLSACAAVVEAERSRARLLLTVGTEGAFGFDGERWTHRPALPVSAVGTAGAGDALLAGVLTALAVGASFASALAFGVLLAAYKVTSPHTIHPDAHLDALLAFAAAHEISLDQDLARRAG